MLRRARADPGLIAGFLAQGLQYGAGLMLMPFVVTRLSAAEVGIWYVFLAAQSLAAVADFGFQPTLARFFSMAHSGVTALARDGMGAPGNGQPNISLLRSLLRAARLLYIGIATLVLVILLAAGLPYLSGLARDGGVPVETVRTAWAIFALAVSANLYFLWVPAYLLGSGRLVANYLYLILARGGFALFGIVVLLAGGGLVALGAGFLASQITARVLAIVLLRGSIAAERGAASADGEEVREVLAAIWPNASRLGLVSIGSFFITRYNVFLLSGSVGLAVSASYAICLQLLSGIASIAQLPMQASLPRIVAARLAGDLPSFRRIALAAAGFFVATFLGAAVVLIGAGDMLLRAIGSTVTLLDRPLLIAFTVVIALEGFHSLAAFVITTRNAVPFVWPALLSGAAVMLLATVAVHLGYGVAGVIAVQGLVQLAYNNWKWPLIAYRECRT
jgi:hypothetical protein